MEQKTKDMWANIGKGAAAVLGVTAVGALMVAAAEAEANRPRVEETWTKRRRVIDRHTGRVLSDTTAVVAELSPTQSGYSVGDILAAHEEAEDHYSWCSCRLCEIAGINGHRRRR